jgi:hypothetical protein
MVTRRRRCQSCSNEAAWHVIGIIAAGLACTDHLAERIWYCLPIPGANVQVRNLARAKVAA